MCACQTGLQQMLIRRSARPLKLCCPWVRVKKLLAEDCSWVCGLHRAKKCCLLLPPWPTHPISFFSTLLGRVDLKETSSSPRKASPRPRRRSWNCWAPVHCPSCAQIILRFWRRTGMHKSCHSMRHVQGAAHEKEDQGCDNLEGKKPGHWMTTVCFSR